MDTAGATVKFYLYADSQLGVNLCAREIMNT